jgi:hypothetical protein
MKAIFYKVAALEEQTEAALDKMVLTFGSRSEEWQQSEKGDAFMERIEALEELREALATYRRFATDNEI